jgi:hypothetical protein
MANNSEMYQIKAHQCRLSLSEQLSKRNHVGQKCEAAALKRQAMSERLAEINAAEING